VRATFAGLAELKDPVKVARLRGIELEQLDRSSPGTQSPTMQPTS